MVFIRADSELAVITKTKDLANTLFAITELSPKKFRMTLVNRMCNSVLEALENLICANDIMLGRSPEENLLRRQYQMSALSKLKVLDSLLLISLNNSCITSKQYTRVTRLIADCIRLAAAWIKSDRTRIEGKL